MIIERVNVDTYLDLTDADSDGFLLDNKDGQQVWLSYEQLDNIVKLTDTLREINHVEEAS